MLLKYTISNMDLGLKNKIIIVTGGSKGIGEGIVSLLAKEAAFPVIVGRNKPSIEKLIDDIPKGFGSRPTIFKFINLAINRKYLLKTSDTVDKRKFILRLSNQSILDFESWAKGFRGF